MYDSEVETIRYDASKGYILLGNNKRSYEFAADTSYINDNEAKTLKKIVIGNTTHFIILNKNSSLKILKTNTKSAPIPGD